MRRLAAFLALLAAAVSCSSHPRHDAPPRAEFLLTSEDSTFWIAAGDSAVHVRGVPMTLTRYGGKFYEIYSADDDFSYDDALLVGDRLYRRDIATGDSAIVFEDTAVVRIATAYAKAHPDERPLDPNDEGEANPSTNATAEIDVLGTFGPYLSYEYHLDVAMPGSRPWHTTRRGVLDLRTGAQATVGDLFGESVGRDVENEGRKRYEETRDSILAERAARRADDRRAADALSRFQFDARSFTLSSLDGKPAIAFDIPGRGEGAVGNVVELDPVTVAPAPWWADVAPQLPASSDEGDDRWSRPGYTIVARYDTLGDQAHVSIVDSARREWPLADVLGPLHGITWLDQPQLADADRRALVKAFNGAASYDETARVASLSPFFTPASYRATHASSQIRSRKPARNVRADDAGARQQQWARVRRRHPVDDGQGVRHLRVSAQPRQRGHGVDRPRRLSRADSPRRSGRHEVQPQLRRQVVDGSRRSR